MDIEEYRHICERMKYAVVFRENKPYPVRHIITTTDDTIKDFFEWYYSIYQKFDDDKVIFFKTREDAIEFESLLERKLDVN